MKQVDFSEVKLELNQARRALLDYFEMTLPPEEFVKARKKIMDVMSPNDGLAYRIGRTLGIDMKGNETDGIQKGSQTTG